jgi:hypothetical protein
MWLFLQEAGGKTRKKKEKGKTRVKSSFFLPG